MTEKEKEAIWEDIEPRVRKRAKISNFPPHQIDDFISYYWEYVSRRIDTKTFKDHEHSVNYFTGTTCTYRIIDYVRKLNTYQRIIENLTIIHATEYIDDFSLIDIRMLYYDNKICIETLLYAAGYTQVEIAAMGNTSKATVCRRVKADLDNMKEFY